VQHGYNLFDEAALARDIQETRRLGVPVVATEHAVLPRVHPWERDVDMLIALTERGADQLRRRWPGKRVEHVPHGCPTWFPSRKRRRGKVIGAFGFLEPHKGFWQLLDVLRELPGTELLVFSHAKSDEQARRWEEAIRGLRVRWEPRFLPAGEIARRLAADADILAFWYDEVPHASASGAVRIGMATGVPVLASPTSWFSELQDQTWQPDSLVDGVQCLLEDTSLRNHVSKAATDYCKENSWRNIADRHLTLWHALESA
jgi:glycosyltransferase involved in cell wall biosynthesis